MKRALALSRLGTPSPNPYVGCVIVKDRKTIGKGYHHETGQSHAEIVAMQDAASKGHSLAGSEMYVTLEPCCHQGRTPPCTEAIIREKIKKVFVAIQDPNPRVHGKGTEELEKAGVQIKQGLLADEAREVNKIFFTWISTGRPFVTIKVAVTKEGFIADGSGKRKIISNKKSREYAHQLRSRYDAILVGINTVLQDNPQLTTRIPGGKDPLRVIVDSRLQIPLTARVLHDTNVVVATTKQHDPEKKRLLEKKGILCLVLGDKEVDLRKLLQELGRKQIGLGSKQKETRLITSVLVEGGSIINGSFLRKKLADSIIIIKTPRTFDSGVSFAQGFTLRDLQKKVDLKEIARFEEDVVLEGNFKNKPP